MHLVLGFPTRFIGEFGIPTTFVNRLDVILIHISLLLVYTPYTVVAAIMFRFLNKYLFYFFICLKKKYKVGWSLLGVWCRSTYNYLWYVCLTCTYTNVTPKRLRFSRIF
jgi:hypothetical protein